MNKYWKIFPFGEEERKLVEEATGKALAWAERHIAPPVTEEPPVRDPSTYEGDYISMKEAKAYAHEIGVPWVHKVWQAVSRCPDTVGNTSGKLYNRKWAEAKIKSYEIH